VLAQGARLEGVNWISGQRPTGPVQASVRIRYRHEGAAAVIEPDGGDGAIVRFEDPISAVSPGQAAVFDDGDEVLGGGWIAEAVR
jgi:tRNA-specific 2-thiouridylase